MIRRTTVAAEDDDLALLARVAREQGTSLGRLLGVLVAKEAEAVRRSRRPRVAAIEADASIADVSFAEEPPAHLFRS